MTLPKHFLRAAYANRTSVGAWKRAPTQSLGDVQCIERANRNRSRSIHAGLHDLLELRLDRESGGNDFHLAIGNVLVESSAKHDRRMGGDRPFSFSA